MTTHSKNRPSGFTLVEIMIVVVLIGMLAAFAIPQFTKIRTRSQDAAVLNNVRQLASASSQYFLEYGVTSVSADKIVGVDKYVKNLEVLAKETYPLGYTQDVAITVTGIGGARTLTYMP